MDGRPTPGVFGSPHPTPYIGQSCGGREEGVTLLRKIIILFNSWRPLEYINCSSSPRLAWSSCWSWPRRSSQDWWMTADQEQTSLMDQILDHLHCKGWSIGWQHSPLLLSLPLSSLGQICVYSKCHTIFGSTLNFRIWRLL